MNQLENAEVIKTPVSEGVYTIDGKRHTVEQLCERGLAYDQSLLKPWSLGTRTILAVASHEAAEVLRRHGHTVGSHLVPEQ